MRHEAAARKDSAAGGTRIRRGPEACVARAPLAVAANAIGGCVYGLGAAPNVATEWLEGSRFRSYRVLSLVLGIGAAGSALVAAAPTWRRHPRAPQISLATSAILGGWILAQLTVIGYGSPLQPAMLRVAVIEPALAAQSRRRSTDPSPSTSNESRRSLKASAQSDRRLAKRARMASASAARRVARQRGIVRDRVTASRERHGR